jgi:hypothetical protein
MNDDLIKTTILHGHVIDALKGMPSESVHLIVTSPPYWKLREYGTPPQTWPDGWVGELGLEDDPRMFVAHLMDVFREARRVLRPDGFCVVNLGDTYRDKDMVGIPWMFAEAARDDGWWWRFQIPWLKRNGMATSVTDRPGVSNEWVTGLAKGPQYFWDVTATRTPQKTIGKRHEGKSGYREGHPSKGGIKVRSLNPSGAAPRTGDWTFDAIDFLIDEQREWLAHLERIKDGGQWLVCDPEGDPLAVVANVVSSKEFHFAAYPPRFVEPFVRAGTSEQGCCKACGNPMVRVVEKERVATRPGNNSKVYADPQDSPYKSHSGAIVGNRDPKRHCTVFHTKGWAPSCSCDAGDPVPCTVLDPFGGTGVTAEVAMKLGRQAILIELGEPYVGIAERRVGKLGSPMFPASETVEVA